MKESNMSNDDEPKRRPTEQFFRVSRRAMENHLKRLREDTAYFNSCKALDEIAELSAMYEED